MAAILCSRVTSDLRSRRARQEFRLHVMVGISLHTSVTEIVKAIMNTSLGSKKRNRSYLFSLSHSPYFRHREVSCVLTQALETNYLQFSKLIAQVSAPAPGLGLVLAED